MTWNPSDPQAAVDRAEAALRTARREAPLQATRRRADARLDRLRAAAHAQRTARHAALTPTARAWEALLAGPAVESVATTTALPGRTVSTLSRPAVARLLAAGHIEPAAPPAGRTGRWWQLTAAGHTATTTEPNS